MKIGKHLSWKCSRFLHLIMPMLVFLFASCATSLRHGSAEILVSHYGDESIKYSSRLKGELFIGISGYCQDEASARAQAERNAREQIIQSIETRISSSMIDSLLIMNTDSDILTSTSWTNRRLVTLAHNVISVRPNAFYIERWARQGDFTTNYHYIAWCSMEFSRERHSWLLEEHVKALEATVEEHAQTLLAARRNGRWHSIIRQLAEIEEACDALTNTYSGFSATQLDRLRTVSNSGSEMLSQLSVEIRAKQSGNTQIDQTLNQSVIQLARTHLPFRIVDRKGYGADLIFELSPAFLQKTITAGLVRAELNLELTLRSGISSETLWVERLAFAEVGSSRLASERAIRNQLTSNNSKLNESIDKLVRQIGFQGGLDEGY